jgi:hypothetical protein
MLTQTNQPARSFFGDMLTRAKSVFARWREVRQLDSQEIDAVARDLNISSAELVSLMFTSSDSVEALGKRLAYAGLSEQVLTALHPDELRDMRRVCSQCLGKARCARDLRHKRMANPSKYCPNEPTLRALVLQACQERAVQPRGFPTKVS